MCLEINTLLGRLHPKGWRYLLNYILLAKFPQKLSSQKNTIKKSITQLLISQIFLLLSQNPTHHSCHNQKQNHPKPICISPIPNSLPIHSPVKSICRRNYKKHNQSNKHNPRHPFIPSNHTKSILA